VVTSKRSPADGVLYRRGAMGKLRRLTDEEKGACLLWMFEHPEKTSEVLTSVELVVIFKTELDIEMNPGNAKSLAETYNTVTGSKICTNEGVPVVRRNLIRMLEKRVIELEKQVGAMRHQIEGLQEAQKAGWIGPRFVLPEAGGAERSA
jgi:hypothetical protein